MNKIKTLLDIRNELLSSFLALDEMYRKLANTNPDRTIGYLDIEFSEHLLNALKSLEYHFRDDVPEMRTKRKWVDEMKRAHKLLAKYGEKNEPKNESSRLCLKKEFDDSGYIEQRSFFEGITNDRKKLKRL